MSKPDELLDRKRTIETTSRDLFRKTLDTKNVHQLPKHLIEPGYHYRAVIYTYKHDPERVERLLDRGWHFVIAAADDEDDRPAATKAERNTRESTIECKFTSGAKAVWMKIESEKLRELEKAKRTQRLEKMVQAGQISSIENGWKIMGPEYRYELEKQ